jgi:hypothetical protein
VKTVFLTFYHFEICKGIRTKAKAVLLHSTDELGGRGDIAPTHS